MVARSRPPLTCINLAAIAWVLWPCCGAGPAASDERSFRLSAGTTRDHQRPTDELPGAGVRSLYCARQGAIGKVAAVHRCEGKTCTVWRRRAMAAGMVRFAHRGRGARNGLPARSGLYAAPQSKHLACWHQGVRQTAPPNLGNGKPCNEYSRLRVRTSNLRQSRPWRSQESADPGSIQLARPQPWHRVPVAFVVGRCPVGADQPGRQRLRAPPRPRYSEICGRTACWRLRGRGLGTSGIGAAAWRRWGARRGGDCHGLSACITGAGVKRIGRATSTSDPCRHRQGRQPTQPATAQGSSYAARGGPRGRLVGGGAGARAQ